MGGSAAEPRHDIIDVDVDGCSGFLALLATGCFGSLRPLLPLLASGSRNAAHFSVPISLKLLFTLFEF